MTRLMAKIDTSVKQGHQVEDEQRAEHRRHADEGRHHRSDDRPEDDDEEQERDRNGDDLGHREVGLGRHADALEDGIATADAHVEDSSLGGDEVFGEPNRECLADGVVGLAGESQEDQCASTVR